MCSPNDCPLERHNPSEASKPALAYLVTLVDLTGQGRLIANASFRFFETFFIVGLIYAALVSLATSLLQIIERRLRFPM